MFEIINQEKVNANQSSANLNLSNRQFVGVGVSTTRCGLIAHFKTGCRGRQPLQKEIDKPQFVKQKLHK